MTLSTGTKDNFLSLSAISAAIRDAVYSRFGEGLYWIVAEIAELNVRKGHCYLSLVEKLPGSAAPVCELKGIVWANKYERIRQVFEELTGVSLAANTSILFQARVKYDVKWGLNLIVEDIEPKYTIGLLRQEREITVARLREEGIFGNNRKLHFPLVPHRVAVISAKDSRGYEDFLNKLVTNPKKYLYEVTLFPSLLQGEKAASEIVNRLIEIYNRSGEFDVVAIVRGGGGTIDLNCFNDFKLSRAVARFPLPVLTGIGHTTNISVVDEVAFADRITPTDAADYIVQKTEEFESVLISLAERIQDAYVDTLTMEESKLERNLRLLNVYTSGVLADLGKQMVYKSEKLRNLAASRIRESGAALIVFKNQLLYLFKSFMNGEQSRINTFLKSAESLPVRSMDQARLKLDQLEKTTHHLDPVNVLRRGFSITSLNGKVIRSPEGLLPGQTIQTRLYEGTIESEIKGTAK